MKYLFGNLPRVQEEIRRAEQVYVMVDYDGTLTPIVSHPRLAPLPSNTKEVLSSLAAQPRCVLAIISGRSKEDVKHLVGVDGAYYMGNHGLEISGPMLNFVHPEAAKISEVLTRIAEELDKRLREIRGVVVENKELTLSIHYRMVAEHSIQRVKATVRDIVRHHRRLKVTYGKKVVEVRPNLLWDKGRAAEWLIRSLGDGLPIYLGDNRTDEDAFSKLRRGVTILVSRRWRPSKARYYVKDTEGVLGFLKSLIPLLESRSVARREG